MDIEKINSFSYNGKNSLDMGLIVSEKENIFGSPKPVVNVVNIPGRGNLILSSKSDPLDNEEYEDFQKTYKCYALPEDGRSVESTARAIHAWLYRDTSYKKLEDSYEREYYRYAYVSEQMSVEEIAARILGQVEIKFTCHAYKFAKSGDRAIAMEKARSLYNTEGFTAYPLIRIYGSGDVTLYINNRAHSFTGIEEYIEVDSRLLNAYKGDALQNNKMLSTVFPKLEPGENVIHWAGKVSCVEITPRWCSL